MATLKASRTTAFLIITLHIITLLDHTLIYPGHSIAVKTVHTIADLLVDFKKNTKAESGSFDSSR